MNMLIPTSCWSDHIANLNLLGRIMAMAAPAKENLWRTSCCAGCNSQQLVINHLGPKLALMHVRLQRLHLNDRESYPCGAAFGWTQLGHQMDLEAIDQLWLLFAQLVVAAVDEQTSLSLNLPCLEWTPAVLENFVACQFAADVPGQLLA